MPHIVMVVSFKPDAVVLVFSLAPIRWGGHNTINAGIRKISSHSKGIAQQEKRCYFSLCSIVLKY